MLSLSQNLVGKTDEAVALELLQVLASKKKHPTFTSPFDDYAFLNSKVEHQFESVEQVLPGSNF